MVKNTSQDAQPTQPAEPVEKAPDAAQADEPQDAQPAEENYPPTDAKMAGAVDTRAPINPELAKEENQDSDLQDAGSSSTEVNNK